MIPYTSPLTRYTSLVLVLLLVLVVDSRAAAPPIEAALEAGLAVRDITPDQPIFLAGYAARRKPSESVDSPLVVQALALRSTGGEPFVFVALDNCEVSRAFMEPVNARLERDHGLKRGSVMVVSSHTHSAPVLENTLEVMAIMPEKDREVVRQYSARLRDTLVEVAVAAVKDLQPAQLEHGVGRTTFAMNRRTYRPEGMSFGENPEGPVDWDVPVLRITGTNGVLRGIVFGYACHGTSIQGEGFYAVNGDYMAYARQHLEAHYPGATALYLTGMGADINPSPRGSLLDAKRHGVELAGAVISVLNRPLRPVSGEVRHAYRELDLAFEPQPDRAALEADAKNNDPFIRRRAEMFLKKLEAGQPLPAGVSLPMSVVRIGDDLSFLSMAGEVVVDYSRAFKRLHAAAHPWTIGYAYEVPCYIPTIRILKEGGYEAQSSLIYYGYYGPFKTDIEPRIFEAMGELVAGTKK
jgi:neutral ceramidase